MTKQARCDLQALVTIKRRLALCVQEFKEDWMLYGKGLGAGWRGCGWDAPVGEGGRGGGGHQFNLKCLLFGYYSQPSFQVFAGNFQHTVSLPDSS